MTPKMVGQGCRAMRGPLQHSGARAIAILEPVEQVAEATRQSLVRAGKGSQREFNEVKREGEEVKQTQEGMTTGACRC